MSDALSQRKWLIISGFMALVVAARAVHWLITHSSSAASHIRWWAVIAQAVLGVALGAWLLWRTRPGSSKVR